MIDPLCIIQARYHSTRLPGKMLFTLDDPVHGTETLIARGWRLACEAFGREQVVIAMPKSDILGPLWDEIQRIGAQSFFPDHAREADVLGRFYECANFAGATGTIVRWTPDDPMRDPGMCQLVANGQRYPVELGGEAFSFKQLCEAQACTPPLSNWREHIGHNPWLFPDGYPERYAVPGYTIDTQADLDAAREILAYG